MTHAQHIAVKESISECLLTYSAMARLAMERGDFRWSLVTKHHFMHHLGDQSKFLNPRTWWCYGFEDMMGKARTLGESCTNGTPALKVASRVLRKYMLAMNFEQRYR